MKKQTYDLEERLLDYSVRIIKIVEQLPKTRVGNHVAGQLLKSGTSPYPNHGEAQAAESPKDFIHKLRISLKELRETQRWLKLIQRVPLIKKPELLNDILQETEELIKIFVTSIKTASKIVFSFDVGRSSFKPSRDCTNATCECLQNNLALMGGIPLRDGVEAGEAGEISPPSGAAAGAFQSLQ